jgi:hypothetical protein
MNDETPKTLNADDKTLLDAAWDHHKAAAPARMLTISTLGVTVNLTVQELRGILVEQGFMLTPSPFTSRLVREHDWELVRPGSSQILEEIRLSHIEMVDDGEGKV